MQQDIGYEELLNTIGDNSFFVCKKTSYNNKQFGKTQCNKN